MNQQEQSISHPSELWRMGLIRGTVSGGRLTVFSFVSIAQTVGTHAANHCKSNKEPWTWFSFVNACSTGNLGHGFYSSMHVQLGTSPAISHGLSHMSLYRLCWFINAILHFSRTSHEFPVSNHSQISIARNHCTYKHHYSTCGRQVRHTL